MESVLRKPAVIAVIVAIVSIATMLVADHTNLIVERRPPATAGSVVPYSVLKWRAIRNKTANSYILEISI